MNGIPWGYIAAIFTSAVIGYVYGQYKGWNEGFTYGRWYTYHQLRQAQIISDRMDKDFT